MAKSFVLGTLMMIGTNALAFNITFDKAYRIELDRCASVLPIKEMTEFAMVSDLGFLTEAQIKEKAGEEFFKHFAELAKVVIPYLDSLDERGEVVDLTNQGEPLVSCAKYAKGVLISPYQHILAEMFMNAFKPKK